MGIALRFAALALLWVASAASAATFTKIADASTPGGGWNSFVSFGNPALDAGQVAVRTADVVSGIYIVSGGSATTVADDTTLPGGASGVPASYSDPALSQGEAAFVAISFGTSTTVYRGSGGLLALVADDSTPDPRGGGRLLREIVFSPPDIEGDAVSFNAFAYNNMWGIYTSTAGVLAVGADQQTWVGEFGNEIVFVQGRGSLDGSQVAYRGYANDGWAIAVAEGDIARLVTEQGMPVPGGTGTFDFFDFLVEMDDGNVVFQGQSAEGWGIYAEIGGVLVPIATGVQASALAIDGDIIAFLTSDGLFAFHDGVLERLIGAGDSLDGKSIVEIRFGEHGLSGDQLAFTASFDDGSDAIYLATIPEPGTGLLLAAGLVALAVRRRVTTG